MAIKGQIQQLIPQIEINLDSSDGNVFVLIKLATDLANKLGKDAELIKKRMMSESYENAVRIFDAYFGDYVTLRTANPERFA